MSLTSYLTGTEHQALRDKFKSEFAKPVFDLDKKIIAPPLTTNNAIVGTAFDYLLRFYIERRYNKVIQTRSWIALTGFRSIQKQRRLNQDFLINLEQRLLLTKRRHQRFLENGRMNRELIADSLFLAKLDLNVRSGLIAPDLLIENEADILDLKQLYAAMPRNSFAIKDVGYLNPGFISADMVGGADADLIIDNTLIDIKCVKESSLTRYYLNQLIGYYILALLHNKKMPTDGRYRINHLGIYFARHAVLYTFPVRELGTKKKISLFTDWFCRYTTSYRQREEDANRDRRIKQLSKKLEKAIKVRDRNAK